MRVRYDGREFLIEFQYEMAICAEYRDEREMTTCWIRDGNAPRGEREPAPAICRGAVARYFQDPPNREKARKESLRKALEFLDQFLPSDAQTAAEGKIRDKDRRRAFWEVYRNRKGNQGQRAVNSQNLT